MKQRNPIVYILIGIIMTLIIIVVYNLIAGQNQNRPSLQEHLDRMEESKAARTTDETEQPSDVEEEKEDEERQEIRSGYYNYMLPSQWEHTERAEKGIQELTEGQRIEFGIVQDPTDENIYYFAASTYDPEEKTNFVGVYKYNVEDYNWERLFKSEFEKGGSRFISDESIATYHVIGYDNGKLIVLVQDINDSPGPCSDPLLLGLEKEDYGGIRNLVSMDIDDPYDSITEYTPSDEAVKEAQKQAEECNKSL